MNPRRRDYAAESRCSELQRTPCTVHPLLRPGVDLTVLPARSGATSTAGHPLQGQGEESPSPSVSAANCTDLMAAEAVAVSPAEPATDLHVSDQPLPPAAQALDHDSPLNASTFDDPLRASPAIEDPLRALILDDRPADSPTPTTPTTVGSTTAASRRRGRSSSVSDRAGGASIAVGSCRPKRGLGRDRMERAAVEAWEETKVGILQRFAASGTIMVSTSLDILSSKPRGIPRSTPLSRLRELEDPSSGTLQETQLMSQQDYVLRLRGLNDDIAHAWLANDRVTALRLAIKVARLLQDTSVLRFYPSLFVLVTDIMDTVGALVWSRIKRRAEVDDGGREVCHLREDFECSDVPQDAKDTCSNWFYKIGSIRDLLPRVYLELAVVRCYCFIEPGLPVGHLHRLSQMIRGLGDPLACCYAQLYLARKVQAVAPDERGILFGAVDDLMVPYRRVVAGDWDDTIACSGLDRSAYLQLLDPPLEFFMQQIVADAPQGILLEALSQFGSKGIKGHGMEAEVGAEEEVVETKPEADEKGLLSLRTGLGPLSTSSEGRAGVGVGVVSRMGGSGGGRPPPPPVQPPIRSVVRHVLQQMPEEFVANMALPVLGIIRSCKDTSLPQATLYLLLGARVCKTSPPAAQRRQLLNEVWKDISSFSDLTEYLAIVNVFLDFVLSFFATRDVELVLADIVRQLRAAGSKRSDRALAALESMVFKILTHFGDLRTVLKIPPFIPLLDAFHGDIQLSVYKRILELAGRHCEGISDPLAIHFLFEVGRVLHDSLDSMSSEDTRRQVAALVACFVQQVDMKHDLEQHLSFLADCRATFFTLDAVQEAIVHVCNRLAVGALRAIPTANGRQLFEFVKSSLAFNEITIPSITSLLTRCHLLLATAEVSLQSGLLAHTEALLLLAISSLEEVRTTEGALNDEASSPGAQQALLSFISKLAAFLIVVPGHPEHGPLYLINGLDAAVCSYAGQQGPLVMVAASCPLLLMAATLAQDQFPYHVDQVESNDVLYSGERSYREEVGEVMDALVQRVLCALEEMPRTEQTGLQALNACSVILTSFQAEGGAIKVVDTLLDVARESVGTNAQLQGYLQRTVELRRTPP